MTDESLHAQLRRIADDPAWSPVHRAAAKQAAVEMPDGPPMSDREVHAMLRQRVVAQCAEPGRPDSIERLRARLDDEVRANLARLDGTTASAVSLLSGIPRDELDQYGGVSDASA